MTHKITSFIIAQTGGAPGGGEPVAVIPGKSAPHYFEKTVPSQFILGQERVNINGQDIELIAKIYHPDIILVEGTLEVPDIFVESTLELKDKLQEACYSFAKKNGVREEPSEEYTLYQIGGYTGDPEN